MNMHPRAGAESQKNARSVRIFRPARLPACRRTFRDPAPDPSGPAVCVDDSFVPCGLCALRGDRRLSHAAPSVPSVRTCQACRARGADRRGSGPWWAPCGPVGINASTAARQPPALERSRQHQPTAVLTVHSGPMISCSTAALIWPLPRSSGQTRSIRTHGGQVFIPLADGRRRQAVQTGLSVIPVTRSGTGSSVLERAAGASASPLSDAARDALSAGASGASI